MAPTPIRVRNAEAALEGNTVDSTPTEAAVQAALAAARPISDVRSSAAYRREMVGVLTEKAIVQAWQQAQDR